MRRFLSHTARELIANLLLCLAVVLTIELALQLTDLAAMRP
ncbi:MAG TPA: hypothetical protein VGU71_22550 [Candidatus Dormibacteraeota bacterium]|nr:hypothetical protein [Candidatus Dormibacteraeota bacterium]